MTRLLQPHSACRSRTQTCVIHVFLLLIPYITQSQCSNNKPTILETFGAGIPRYSNATPANFGFSTTYLQENGTTGGAQTNDGEFSFINSINDYWNVWHSGATDHTGDPGGYMMLVNASYDPGEFYNDTVSGLCVGVTYEFSVWMANLDKLPGRINPNVKFEIRDADTDALIADYVTGNITYSNAMTWRKYSLTFASTTDKVVLLLINNNPGGSGNDIALDDIAFTPCIPQYTIDIKNKFCYGETMQFKTINTGSGFASPDYQWQKKNSTSWTDLSNSSIFTINNATPADSGWYKLIVANSGNLNFPACRSEDSIFIDVYPHLVPGSIGSDQNICLGTSPQPFTNLLSPSGSDENFTYTWEKSTDKNTWTSTNTNGLNFTEINTLSVATYYRRQVTTTCDIGYSDTVSVSITPEVNPGEIETDQQLCNGKSPAIFTEKIAATGGFTPYQYHWEYSDDNLTWIPISGTNTTTYQSPDITNDRWFRRNIKDSKCAATIGKYSNSVKLTFISAQEPIVKDTTLCQQNNFLSPGANGTNLIWYATASSTTGNTTVPPLELSEPGTYTYFVSQTVGGCTSPKSQFSIIVTPKPKVKITGGDICDGNSVTLTSEISNFTVTLSYIWSPAIGLSGTTTSSVSATPGQTSQYTLTVKDGNLCSAADSTIVGVTTQPVADILQNDTTLCQGESLTLTAYNNPIANYTYTWYHSQNNPNQIEIVSTSPNLTIQENGYYIVEVRNDGFCPQRSVPVYIDIEKIGVQAIANKQELYPDEWLQLSAISSGPILNYEWISTEGNSSNQVLNLIPDKDALYTVTAYGKKCKATDTIYVKKLPPIIIPNGFSPNGDSKNDQWIITGLDSYPDAIVKIFNRWGSIVYEYTNGYYEPWNGLSRSGLDLPSATYYYVIEVKDTRKQTFNGSVTILK